MNFLRNSIISNSAAAAAAASAASPAAAATTPALDDLPLADEELRGSFTLFAGSGAVVETSAAESKSEDVARLRNRMPVQGHSDVSANEGSVLIPRRKLPEDWAAAPESTRSDLDRDFVFPGEQLTILVTISSQDVPVPEIITPFKIAAVINKNALLKANPPLQEVSSSEDGKQSGGGLIDAHESLREEAQKKRSAQLLETFRNSHFYVKVVRGDEDELSTGADERTDRKDRNVAPVLMEGNKFDPGVAGGMARHTISSCSLANGDIAVMLQVAVASHSDMEHAIIEVLQYEQRKSPTVASPYSSRSSDPAQELLHWLLPLDRSIPSPAQAPSALSTVTSTNSTSQRISFATANSTLFSFGHLRSSSQGSLPPVTASSPTPSYPPSALNIAPDEWDRLYPHKETLDEGLLSFRGVPLEPQRFSANCGLEGLYVPGKRWRRKISVVQPLAIESYFGNANTEDLICVLVENVLPVHLSDVVIYVDSVSIICQSAGPGSLSQPVPVACVEAGENYGLPNLPLRVGEQHSFILRPTNVNAAKLGTAGSRQGKDDSGVYAVLVSCHCTHTQSSFYVKHALKWKPRSTRDLLISVSLETNSPTMAPNEALPQLKSQVVTVQATNLTSKDLDLTLLTPSTMASSPLPSGSLPNSAKQRVVASSLSFQAAKGELMKETDRKVTSSAPPSRSVSMTPGRRAAPVEKVRPTSPAKALNERRASAADMVAESSSLRTHLWLQSTIPLGHVPAHSTTVVKCDMFPLTDGIINLDTLHIATRDHSTVYTPEHVLQIHSQCGITK